MRAGVLELSSDDSVFHLLSPFILKTSPFVMLYNEGEGCGVLWLAGVGNRHAWTPGFYKTWTGWSFKDLKHHKPLWLDLIMFFSVDLAAHMRCCRLHWRSHQALWEWGEIFWQDRDQGYARDLQEEQEDNWHGSSWVRCEVESLQYHLSSSWRCVHKTGATPMMSAHGKVTDFQMWDHILPDEQLLKVKLETSTCSIHSF